MQTLGRRAITTPHSADLVARFVFVGAVLVLTWAGQEFASGGRASFWYGRSIMGVPLVYPAIIGVLLLAAPVLVVANPSSIGARLKSTGLWTWVIAIWVVLGLGIVRAIGSGVSELFADWRNLVVMATGVIALTPWLASRSWRNEIPTDLAIGYGVLALGVLVQWMAGGGAEVFDQRITIFSWPHLFSVTYSAIVAGAVWMMGMRGLSQTRAIAIRTSATVSSIVVLLSFRRSFWLSLGVGIAGVLIVAGRRGYLNGRRVTALAAVVTLAMSVLFVAMGSEAVIERFSSFLPTSDSSYSATNEDHVNDLIEAVDAIGQNPLLGLGIGQFYETPLLDDWKETSFEVHNALLHVWLKFGFFGLVVFVGFHYRWVVAALELPDVRPDVSAAFAGVAMYIVSQFANTIAQTWVYGRVQMTVQMAVLLAVLLACAPDARRPRRRVAHRSAVTPARDYALRPDSSLSAES